MALNKLNHIYGEPLLVSSLNVEGNTVLYSGLTVLGTATFPSASIGAVSNAEIQYLDGLTGNIQTQLDGKITASQVSSSYAALSGATFTGAISATGLTLTNDLTIANGGTGLSATTKGGIFVGTSTSGFTNLTVGTDGYLLTADSAQASGVKWAAAPVSLPTQTGNNGKYLTTDGTAASWVTLNALPTQTGNTGKFLTTDGTTSSWATLTASNLTGGTLSSTILGNSTVYIGSTAVALNRATGNLALTGISSVALPGSTSGTTTVQASAAAGTTTFTLPATTGTAALVGSTFFVGTTSIANNRASASQTLTGVSIDGNAATASAVAAANISGTTLNSGITASSLTTVGTVTSGTWSASFGAVSGANLTSLTAGNLSGTIPSSVLGNSTVRIGTTAIALNRASAAQTLTGVSIDGNAATATTAGSVTNGLTTSNYSSYALPLAGGGMGGRIDGYPTGAGVSILNANDNGNFSVRSIASNATSPAMMSFHRPGIYAINMGLDTDNHFKIGGWSAGAVMMTLTNAGAITIPSNFSLNSQISFSASNPTISSSSYVTLPGGLYVSGGTLYSQVIIQARGGIQNDSGTAITMYGGTSGQVNFTGYITIASDERLKKDIVKIDNALTKVQSLNGYTYLKEGRAEREMGVIAQEVLKVAPELVSENEDDGMLSVSYQNMVALLIEAVKEQSAEIAALKEQVEELKG